MDKIGRYEIRETLGSGAMADVLAAFDPDIHRTLAIKLLKPVHAEDKQYVSRFLREAKAAGALNHRNIVTIFDVGEVDDRPFILMELVDGEPLDEIIAEQGKLSVPKVVKIGIQLADALHYAHERGVVHRDIKPSNIMVLKDQETVKIADFGIARFDDPASSEKTIAGSILGTPQYMSPEQVLGHPVDGRSDLFSVGVILYLLLSGEKPFRGDTMGSLMMNITQTPPPPLRELAADVPQGLQRIVEKLLAKKPDERFPDGQALHKALEAELRRIEGVEGVEKAAPSLSIRYQLTAVMTAVVALVSGLGVWGVHQKEREVIGQLTRDAGASLVQVIAVELAEPITVGDLVTVEVTVADIMGQESFAYLHVAGPDRIIKVSSDSSLVGRPLPEIDQVSLPGTAGVEIARTNDVEGEEALEFTAPIRYAGRNQGFVELGIDTAPTRAAFNATLTILGLAAMVITVLVGAVAYYLIGLLSKPIRTLREGLDAVAGGDLDARISHRRRDEVGGVFDAFNALAGRIAGLRDPSEARTAPMDQKPSDSMTGTLTDAAPPTDLDAVPEDATVIAPPQLASPPPDPSSGTDPAPPTADPDDPFAEPAPDDPGPDKRDDGAQ